MQKNSKIFRYSIGLAVALFLFAGLSALLSAPNANAVYVPVSEAENFGSLFFIVGVSAIVSGFAGWGTIKLLGRNSKV